MRKFFFYKDEYGWFVDLPEWEGEVSDLQMVAGADHFLDILAQGELAVHVLMSEESIEGCDVLEFKELGKLETWEMGTGAWYNVSSINGTPFFFTLWLCDVTKHPTVFGRFPEKIYFKKL